MSVTSRVVSVLAAVAHRGVRVTVEGWVHALVLGTRRGPPGRSAGC